MHISSLKSIIEKIKNCLLALKVLYTMVVKSYLIVWYLFSYAVWKIVKFLQIWTSRKHRFSKNIDIFHHLKLNVLGIHGLVIRKASILLWTIKINYQIQFILSQCEEIGRKRKLKWSEDWPLFTFLDIVLRSFVFRVHVADIKRRV